MSQHDENKYPAKGWGSKQQPIIVRVQTQKRAEQVARVCDHFGWYYILGIEAIEDITDLKKAIKANLTQANVYDPCLCGSGKKYKFCCAGKLNNLDMNAYLQ
ncbi:MAG: DNA-binding protein [Paenibacillaceae bacterium]|nr:DNA-binding protein [Paenibacillaceae bacterium]